MCSSKRKRAAACRSSKSVTSNRSRQLKDINIPHLARLARDGYAILPPIPSCTLMYKQELPLMFPEDAEVPLVKEAMWDPFEYLVARKRDGLLKTDFKQPLGTVSYHVPCHARVQNIGRKTEELLKLLPDTTVNTVERCSGHSGVWGTRKQFHAMAMKIGKPVFRNMASAQARLHELGLPARRPSHRPGHRTVCEGGARAARRRTSRTRSRWSELRTDCNRRDAMECRGQIPRDSLLTLEAYARERNEFRAQCDRAQEKSHRAARRSTSR